MNYIFEYYQAMSDGSITVGHWIREWYARIVDGLQTGLYRYDGKRAARVIRFVEAFCRHCQGPLAPGLVRLELWQKAMLSVMYGIVDDDGARYFREAFISMGRKNGKTLLMAALACYHLFMDGEYGPYIVFAAPKKELADLCYDAVFQMIDKEPELRTMAKKRRSDIYVPENNGTAKPIANSAKRSDGLNISLGVADEIAAWEGDRGLKFYEVLRSSQTGRKESFLVSISTAGYTNGSIYDELFTRSTAVINGNSRERRLAPFLYTVDDPAKWEDINEVQKANPNLGVSVFVDNVLEDIRIAQGSLSKRAEFLCKTCCIKQNAATAWLEYGAVMNAGRAPVLLEDYRDNYAVGGIDLSRSGDLTSACVIIERGGILHVYSHFWIPTARLDDATKEDNVPYKAMIERGWLSLSGDHYVDYEDAFRWYVEIVERFGVYPLQIGYDKYNAVYLTKELEGYGFHCDPVFQGPNLTPCIREFEGLLKDGKIDLGDNDLLKSHLLNTALKADNDGQRVQMVKISTGVHIDGAAALIDAICVRQKWYAEIGGQLQNRGTEDGTV